VAIRGHELRSQEVVAGQPELAGDAPNTAPQGESRDSGVGRGADGSCEPKGERFAVELAEQSTALDARHPGDRVDLHGAYRREVDHDPAVAPGLTGLAMTAAAHRGEQIMRGREVHRAAHISGAHAATMRAGRRSKSGFQSRRAAS